MKRLACCIVGAVMTAGAASSPHMSSASTGIAKGGLTLSAAYRIASNVDPGPLESGLHRGVPGRGGAPARRADLHVRP